MPHDDPLLDGQVPDYADSFVVEARPGDARTSEELLRAGLEGAPQALRAAIPVIHRWVLGFRLAPRSAPGHILGWRILTSEPDAALIGTSGLRGRALIVGRKQVDAGTVELTTYVFFGRSVSRLVWRVVGPVHRRVAPLLLTRAVRPE